MFLDEMESERKEAQDKKVADTILRLLTNLKLTSNDNNKVRWVWELVQNAKDVANSTGKVNININLSKSNVEFSHNGKVFTTKNLIYLIEQVSSKDREIEESGEQDKKVTGKFGTGFLTTHLLSPKVQISGLLEDKNGIKRYIDFELDRSGSNHNEITDCIHKSYVQIDQSKKICDDFDENNFNTVFKYKLDDKGIIVAKKGIQNLHLGIPYVFAFIPEIEIITINNGYLTFQRGEIHNTESKDIDIHEIISINNGQSKKIFTCVLKHDDISIAFPVLDLESNEILEYRTQLPKIFCGFPLIGTESFAFPVVINSPLFNPTEPRDSIFLSDEDDDRSNENKNLMLKACELYKSVLDYITKNEYKNIYNITKINSQSKEDYVSADWVNNNVVEKCKEAIRYKPIVNSQDGNKKSLYDEFLDKSNMWILSDNKTETREEMWELINHIYPDMLTKKLEIHNWYDSLWNECHNFSLMDLVEEVEQYKSLENIEQKFNSQITSIEWLNKLYKLICENKEVKREILENNIKIFPNQNGELCSAIALKYDEGIDDVYKDILKNLNYDCRKYLLDCNISIKKLINLEKYNYEDIFTDILDRVSKDTYNKDDVYKKILVLRNESNKEDEQIIILAKYIDVLFPNYLPDYIEVNEISEELLDNSKKYLCTKIADRINSYGNIKNLEESILLQESMNVKQFIAEIIDYFIKYDHSNLLTKKTKPILPNQNGILKIQEELFLDSDEIDEELKDISCSVGKDIREDLLIKEIFLTLPDNRNKSIKDIAPNITSYVREHQGESKKDETIKDIYKNLYLWIDNNEDKAKEYFLEIYKNKHWLYNDSQIAECMEKSDKYDEVDGILKQYDIKDIDQLRKILNKNEIFSNVETAEISNTNSKVTKELLAQYGIYTQDKLNRAIENKIFGENFIHDSEADKEKLDFVNDLLERSKKNVMEFLSGKEGYNLNNLIEVDKTIFIIEKNEKQICLLIRPSDYNQVIVYYNSEKDVLDSQDDMDWELWVEDGESNPQKLTFGKILKLTGINRIPLRRIR